MSCHGMLSLLSSNTHLNVVHFYLKNCHIHAYTAMMMPQTPMAAPPVTDPMQMAATQALINQQAFLMVRTRKLSMLLL